MLPVATRGLELGRMALKIPSPTFRAGRWCMGGSLVLASALTAHGAAPLLENAHLFEEKTRGYFVYRIPGLIVTSRGTVLAYCEARKLTGFDWGEIEIHLRRSSDGGRTFSTPQQIAHLGPRLPRNPVIYEFES